MENWQCMSNQPMPIDVFHAEWSFDDRLIATCGQDDKINIWKASDKYLGFRRREPF